MILILSEEIDISTDCAIEWLRHYGVAFKRINTEKPDSASVILVTNGQVDACFDHCTVNISDVDSVWFRRGYVKYEYSFNPITVKNIEIKRQVFNFLSNEAQAFSGFVYRLLQNTYSIGDPLEYNLNKLEILWLATVAGLRIPDTIVCNNAERMKEFAGDSDLVTKAASNNISIMEENRSYGVGTRKVAEVEDKFFPTLFQHQVKRFCELRILFIGKSFYPMAIFVDEDLDDGRSLVLNQDRARLVPFKLPGDIEEKLLRLISMKNLTTGSIDMILGKNDDYYFLEINPVGQYDYLEHTCNYPISREIALKLINHA